MEPSFETLSAIARGNDRTRELKADRDLLVRNVQVALGALVEGKLEYAKTTLIEALDGVGS